MNTLLKLATEAHGGVGGRRTPLISALAFMVAGAPIRPE